MIYAIGDLHLSSGLPGGKPMDIFGDDWTGHMARIQVNWLETVGPRDTVLVPGDISWAMTMDEFKPDFDFIDSLPGQKVLINGNHDYWWNATTKLNELSRSMFFLKNNFTKAQGYHICGTRGWICPNDSHFTSHDAKIYNRELGRLGLSLNAAMDDGAQAIIVMLHYPPFNDKGQASGFVEMIKKYPVDYVVYGHLHGHGRRFGFNGVKDGITYRLVSADHTGFRPVRLYEQDEGISHDN